jgi:uncharacterized protein YacL
VLRFTIVIFLGGVGNEVAGALPPSTAAVGLFDQTALCTLIGAAAGYVLGGVIGRSTGRSLRVAEAALLGRSVEQVLAGLVGSVVGVISGAALSSPTLLLGRSLLAAPVVVFVTVTMGTLGYRVGTARKDSLIGLIGPRTGMVAPPVALTSLPRILDTSVAIDGRVLDVVRAGFLHGTLVVPQPVLDELQGLADAAEDGRRTRGRRGLVTLEALRRERGVDLEVVGDEAPEVAEVDAKLLRMTLDRGAALLTLDTNLAKAAALAGCRVMNLHALTLALRPPVGAGDTVLVHLTRPGKEPGQAVGYLDDGTMLVVERARDRVGSELEVVVTSVLTTANGRMVFARRTDVPAPRPAPAVPGPR